MRRLRLAVTMALAAWLGLFGARAASASAKISISPAYAEMQLDKGRASGEFTITNTGDADGRFRIETKHFIFSREGSEQEVEPDEHSMALWIVFNPKEFTVPANSRRSIRWVVVPRGELRNGEYWCFMKLESLDTSVVSSTDKEGHEMKIEIQSSVIVPMFGTVGKVTYQGALKDVRVAAADDGSNNVEALIVNEGNGRLGPIGKYEITDASGAVVAKGEGVGLSGYVMPGNDRLFKSKLKDPLPAGKYTLRMEFASAKLTEPLTKEVTFDWIPPPPPLLKAPAASAPATSGTTAAPPAPAPTSPPATVAPAGPVPVSQASAPGAG